MECHNGLEHILNTSQVVYMTLMLQWGQFFCPCLMWRCLWSLAALETGEMGCLVVRFLESVLHVDHCSPLKIGRKNPWNTTIHILPTHHLKRWTEARMLFVAGLLGCNAVWKLVLNFSVSSEARWLDIHLMVLCNPYNPYMVYLPKFGWFYGKCR